jgi:hypothetical protein
MRAALFVPIGIPISRRNIILPKGTKIIDSSPYTHVAV